MTTEDKNNSNSKKAFDYLISKGVKEHIAAGLVGNLMQESYQLENTWASGELDNVGSKGIMQWHGKRLNSLYDFVKEKDANYVNGSPVSLYDQLDFILYEANTGAGDPWMKEQYDKAFSASNSEEAALAFSNNVLRPSRKHAKNDRRIAYANSFDIKNDNGDINRIDPNSYKEVSTVSIDSTDVAQNYVQPKLFNSQLFSEEDFSIGSPEEDISSINPNIEPEDMMSSEETPSIQPEAQKESYADYISKYVTENSDKFALGGYFKESKDNGFNSFDEGGTHEQNPYGGIPMGFDNNGTMNTVEEGESSFDFEDGKYIFSNRIKL